VKRFEYPVRSLLYRLVGNDEDAEDLAQETFIRVYLHLKRFRGGSSLKTWILKIAANLALDQMRQRQRRPVMKQLDPSETGRLSGAPGQTPPARLSAKERSDAVARALEGLPGQQRAALLLKIMHGMNYGEIAGILDTSASSIKSSIHLARKKLMALVADIL
jgi:RNA polymerase sigma-70 factor (ECF subfamily)